MEKGSALRMASKERGRARDPFLATDPGSRDSKVGSSFAGRDPPARWGPSSPTAAGPASWTTELQRVPQPRCFWDPALAPAVTSSWGHEASMRSRAMRAIHSFDKFRLSGYYLCNRASGLLDQSA